MISLVFWSREVPLIVMRSSSTCYRFMNSLSAAFQLHHFWWMRSTSASVIWGDMKRHAGPSQNSLLQSLSDFTITGPLNDNLLKMLGFISTKFQCGTPSCHLPRSILREIRTLLNSPGAWPTAVSGLEHPALKTDANFWQSNKYLWYIPDLCRSQSNELLLKL